MKITEALSGACIVLMKNKIIVTASLVPEPSRVFCPSPLPDKINAGRQGGRQFTTDEQRPGRPGDAPEYLPHAIDQDRRGNFFIRGSGYIYKIGGRIREYTDLSGRERPTILRRRQHSGIEGSVIPGSFNPVIIPGSNSRQK